MGISVPHALLVVLALIEGPGTDASASGAVVEPVFVPLAVLARSGRLALRLAGEPRHHDVATMSSNVSLEF